MSQNAERRFVKIINSCDNEIVTWGVRFEAFLACLAFVLFHEETSGEDISEITYFLDPGVRSLWRRFLNQLLTWNEQKFVWEILDLFSQLTCVRVRPVFLASCRFSSGVGYLNSKFWLFMKYLKSKKRNTTWKVSIN